MKNLKNLLDRKPKVARPRKTQDSNTRAPGLDQAKFVFQALSNLGDGVLTIPGLKAAAQLVVQIIEVAQKVESNQADCAVVAERAYQLVNTAITAVASRPDAEIDDHLKQNVDSLTTHLEEILKILNGITSPKSLIRIMKSDEHQQEIARCEKMLDQAFKVFNVDATITTQLDIAEIKQKLLGLTLTAPLSENLQLSSTPPPAPEIFFGRNQFVANAVSLLETSRPARIAILGAPGIGKTATALTILHDERVKKMFQDHIFFVACEAAPAPSFLVRAILQVLGVQHSEGEDSLSTLHEHLVFSEDMLIILDNFETPWEAPGFQSEVREVLCRITSVRHVSIVVTMRGNTSPSGIVWSQPDKLSVLPPLDPEAARSAFLTVNSNMVDVESDVQLRTLLQEMDYVPLAIMLMAQVGKGEDCTYLLKRWRDERTSLLQTQGSQSCRLDSVDVSISMSLQSALMAENPNAVKLLAILCHLPDGLLKWKQTLQNIMCEFHYPHRLVAILLRACLAYDEAGSLKVLSPIRHYILVNHPADMQHIQIVEQYYVKLIAEHATTSFGHKFLLSRAVLDPELGNISHVLRFSVNSNTHPRDEILDAVYQISFFLHHTIPSTDLLLDIWPYLDTHIVAVKKPKFYQLMGIILYKQTKYPEATAMLLEAQKQFTNIDDQHGVAQCLQSLGNILRMKTEYAEAMEILVKAQKKFIGIGDQLGAAQCQQRQGDILRRQGQFEEAKIVLLNAQEQFIQIKDQLGAAQCMRSLGDILGMQCQYAEATEILLKAHEEFTKIGNQLGISVSLRSLADVLTMTSQYKEAGEMLVEAQKNYSEMGDLLGIAHCLRRIGDNLRMQGQYSEATEVLLEAHNQFLEIGNQLETAHCLQSLGNISNMQAKHKEAKKMLMEAQTQFTEIGNFTRAEECAYTLSQMKD